MPLARIDLAKGKSADYRKTIGDVVYDAMIETLKATAVILSRQIDEVRCSIATERLAGLLAQ